MTIVTTTTTPTTAIISCLAHVNEDNFYIFYMFSDCTVCLFGHDVLLSNVIKMSIVSTSSR